MLTTPLRRRHDLYDQCQRHLGPTSADELMSAIAPPGWDWGEVATKHDLRDGLAALGQQLRAEMAEGFRRQQSWMVATVVGVATLAIAIVGLALAVLVR